MSEGQSRNAMMKMALAAVVVISVAGFLYWFFICPCDRLSGGYLLGTEAEAQVADWSLANEVTLCQIQFSAGLLPHSINLNCMATPSGDLYLSCSQCAPKHWSNTVLENGTARLRLNDTVYPVTLTRVTDPRRARPSLARAGDETECAPRAGKPGATSRHTASRPLVVVPRRLSLVALQP